MTNHTIAPPLMLFFSAAAMLLPLGYMKAQESPSLPVLPGTVMAYSPPSSGRYLGSPMLVRCGDGSLLSSHDWFGPKSSEGKIGQTFLVRSRDEGKTWSLGREMRHLTSPQHDDEGVYWQALYRDDSLLYSMGAASISGPLVIRRSEDHGNSWTVVDETQGRLLPPENGKTWACGPLVLTDTRGCWAVLENQRSARWADNQIKVLHAKSGSVLLRASSWQSSNVLTGDPSWLEGSFRGWLEASPLVTREGKMLATLRVDHRRPNGAGIGGKAALIHIDPSATSAPRIEFSAKPYDPAQNNASGFIDFPGGGLRFIIRYDRNSDRYWSVCNYIPRRFRNERYNAERFRGVLVLVSSVDLTDWKIERIIMHDPRLYAQDAATVRSAFEGPISGKYFHTSFGLQYPWFLIEGDDLLVVVRAAWQSPDGPPHAGHDANYHTFTRVTRFRCRSQVEDFRWEPVSTRENGVRFIRYQARPARIYQWQCSDDATKWRDAGDAVESLGGMQVMNMPDAAAGAKHHRIIELGESWIEGSVPPAF